MISFIINTIIIIIIDEFSYLIPPRLKYRNFLKIFSDNYIRTSMDSWIAHVKQYASSNNVSYKTAMKQAGPSYTKKVKAVKEKRVRKSKK